MRNSKAIGDELDRLEKFWTIEKFCQCMESGGNIEHKVDEQVDLEIFAALGAKFIDLVSS